MCIPENQFQTDNQKPANSIAISKHWCVYRWSMATTYPSGKIERQIDYFSSLMKNHFPQLKLLFRKKITSHIVFLKYIYGVSKIDLLKFLQFFILLLSVFHIWKREKLRSPDNFKSFELTITFFFQFFYLNWLRTAKKLIWVYVLKPVT